MKKLIRHFKRWNVWRKRNGNSKLHQFLVLIGLHNSPTMNQVILKEEWDELCDGVNNLALSQKTKEELIDWLKN